MSRQVGSLGDIFEQVVVAYVDSEQKGMHDGLDETLDESENEEYRRYSVQRHSTKLENNYLQLVCRLLIGTMTDDILRLQLQRLNGRKRHPGPIENE